MINRSAITVRAKAPFLDWLRALPDPVDAMLTLDLINSESSVYLLPGIEDDAHQEFVITDFYSFIFELQLSSWWEEEGD